MYSCAAVSLSCYSVYSCAAVSLSCYSVYSCAAVSLSCYSVYSCAAVSLSCYSMYQYTLVLFFVVVGIKAQEDGPRDIFCDQEENLWTILVKAIK